MKIRVRGGSFLEEKVLYCRNAWIFGVFVQAHTIGLIEVPLHDGIMCHKTVEVTAHIPTTRIEQVRTPSSLADIVQGLDFCSSEPTLNRVQSQEYHHWEPLIVATNHVLVAAQDNGHSKVWHLAMDIRVTWIIKELGSHGTKKRLLGLRQFTTANSYQLHALRTLYFLPATRRKVITMPKAPAPLATARSFYWSSFVVWAWLLRLFSPCTLTLRLRDVASLARIGR